MSTGMYQKIKAYFTEKRETTKAQSAQEYERADICCDAFFNYSLVLPEKDEPSEEILIMGSFAMKNQGIKDLHHPIICLRIKPVEGSRLGGKIGTLKKQEPFMNASPLEEWEYVHTDWKDRIKDKGEHWLRPLHCSAIPPGDMLVFSSFDLCFFMPHKSRSVIVDGFVFCDEFPSGVAAANSIIINF